MRRLARRPASIDRSWLCCLAASFLLCTLLPAQTPDASVRGIVTDAEGRALAGAKVTATQPATGFTQADTTGTNGEYYFGSLPRGVYTLAFALEGYQERTKQGVELPVGARQEENAILNRVGEGSTSNVSHVIENMIPPQALPVDTLSSSVSVVVDEEKILNLPLANRNIYSLFLLQPGVTSQGAIVRRGLSFSVHGQRVSGSNYLLDGTDNNDIVLTGPVGVVSAEGIQEFRMVKSSFSAENGRATSFVAQVVTRSGSNRFHGSLFEFLANDKLNANTFENNSHTQARPAFRQNQFGYSTSGPIQRSQTFFTSVLELSRLRFRETEDLRLPSSVFIGSLPKDSQAYRLLQEIPPLPSIPTAENSSIGFTRAETPSRIDTWLATERIDHQFKNTRDRVTGRYALSSTSQEFSSLSYGYPRLTPTDMFRAHNALVGWTHSFNSGQVNDLRVGWNRERIEMPRPRSDVPELFADGVELPSSLRQTAIRENNNVIQFSDAFSIRRGRSALSMGLQYRKNLSNGASLGIENEALGAAGRVPDGVYFFNDLASFGQGRPSFFFVAVDHFASGPLRRPDLSRKYRSEDHAAFFQDDVKLNRRLSLNIGLRYEYFGVMHNNDPSKDVNFYFGPGATIQERLASGNLRSTDENSGDLKGRLYRPDFLNLAPSIGLAWDVRGTGQTVLRAGYSAAVDRVFDTVRDLRTNFQQLVGCFDPCTPSFTVPIEPMLATLSRAQLLTQDVVQLDANLRTPYAQNWYLGMQHAVTPNFLMEIGHAGSVGRKLISRDVINRSSLTELPINSNYYEDTFLSNEGNSNYLALETSLRHRFSRGFQAQASYTYSHAIDNQSDVFEGPRTGPYPDDFALATFTRQFDARSDRGNADFDQRHNLVLSTIWEMPASHFASRWSNRLLSGWTASVIGAHRSGFPITAIGPEVDDATSLRNNRVDFVGGSTRDAREAVPGGIQFLNPNVFQLAEGRIGSLGRGAIAGPGFWNYDFALLRNINVGETGVRVQIRAEFYNVFNHPNLSVPVTQYLDPRFGQAYYGLNRSYSRFGELLLENPSRRIQLGIRVWF
jgi:Carboxypeptidase regulatory-like domain/TonB dependent receptor